MNDVDRAVSDRKRRGVGERDVETVIGQRARETRHRARGAAFPRRERVDGMQNSHIVAAGTPSTAVIVARSGWRCGAEGAGARTSHPARRAVRNAKPSRMKPHAMSLRMNSNALPRHIDMNSALYISPEPSRYPPKQYSAARDAVAAMNP